MYKPFVVRIGLVALALLSAPTVQAKGRVSMPGTRPATAVYQPISLVVPRALRNRGMSQLGAIHLDQLIEELTKVEWSVFNLGFISASGGKRTTAMYLVKSKQVFVTELAWQWVLPQFQPLMALHEGLGASGYDDENYQISTTLFYLAQIPAAEADEIMKAGPFLEILQSVVRRTKEPKYLLASGGATGVGGGGDYLGAEAKVMLLFLARHEAEGNPATLAHDQFEKVVQMILASNIESDNDYAHNGQTFFSRGLGGQAEIRISSFTWIFSAVTKDMALKVQTLLPIYDRLKQEILN